MFTKILAEISIRSMKYCFKTKLYYVLFIIIHIIQFIIAA